MFDAPAEKKEKFKRIEKGQKYALDSSTSVPIEYMDEISDIYNKYVDLINELVGKFIILNNNKDVVVLTDEEIIEEYNEKVKDGSLSDKTQEEYLEERKNELDLIREARENLPLLHKKMDDLIELEIKVELDSCKREYNWSIEELNKKLSKEKDENKIKKIELEIRKLQYTIDRIDEFIYQIDENSNTLREGIEGIMVYISENTTKKGLPPKKTPVPEKTEEDPEKKEEYPKKGEAKDGKKEIPPTASCKINCVNEKRLSKLGHFVLITAGVATFALFPFGGFMIGSALLASSTAGSVILGGILGISGLNLHISACEKLKKYILKHTKATKIIEQGDSKKPESKEAKEKKPKTHKNIIVRIHELKDKHRLFTMKRELNHLKRQKKSDKYLITTDIKIKKYEEAIYKLERKLSLVADRPIDKVDGIDKGDGNNPSEPPILDPVGKDPIEPISKPNKENPVPDFDIQFEDEVEEESEHHHVR